MSTATRTTACVAVDHNEADCAAAGRKPRERCAPCKRADQRAFNRQLEEAHAEGCHDDYPREFCPECER